MELCGHPSATRPNSSSFSTLNLPANAVKPCQKCDTIRYQLHVGENLCTHIHTVMDISFATKFKKILFATYVYLFNFKNFQLKLISTKSHTNPSSKLCRKLKIVQQIFIKISNFFLRSVTFFFEYTVC